MLNDNNNELMHYGVLGMRWGHRSGGGSRVNSNLSFNLSGSNSSSKNKKTRNKTTKKLNSSRKIMSSGSDIANKTTTYVNKRNSAKRNKQMNDVDLSKMSDTKLRETINRKNLERQYKEVTTPANVSVGRERASAIVDGVGTTLAIGSSAVAIALAVREFKS